MKSTAWFGLMVVGAIGCAVPPTDHGVGGGSMPFSTTAMNTVVQGSVREVLQVPGYTYALVQTPDALRWVVCLHQELSVGSRVRVHAFGARAPFHSARLKRTFEELWFGTIHNVEADLDALGEKS